MDSSRCVCTGFEHQWEDPSGMYSNLSKVSIEKYENGHTASPLKYAEEGSNNSRQKSSFEGKCGQPPNCFPVIAHKHIIDNVECS